MALMAVGTIWWHRISGRWPWDGYTPGSALREWAGSVGLLEHHGRPGFWASRWNRVAALFLLAVFGSMVLAALFLRYS